MQIVIDIPEAEYEDIKYFDTIVDESRDYIASSILNGIPLPKGHGRLMDVNDLLNAFWTYCRKGDFGYHQAEDLIKSAKPIIEADKEGR